MSSDEIGLDTISRMIREVDPDWTVRDVESVSAGHTETYVLTIETATGGQSCVLKCADNEQEQLRVEPRLLHLLSNVTELPIPAVYGIVDTHEVLPTPFFLMERFEGREVSALNDRSPDVLKYIAYETGRYLGELHSVDAFDTFGRISTTYDVETTKGTSLLAQKYGLATDDPSPMWKITLREMVEYLLYDYENGPLKDPCLHIRSVLSEWITTLEGSFSPIIGRIDHHLENVLVDPNTHAINGLIDWAWPALAVHSEYDLAAAEHAFCGTAPVASSGRKRIQSALRAGYEETNQLTRDERFDQRWRLYQVIVELATVNHDRCGSDILTTHRRFVDNLI